MQATSVLKREHDVIERVLDLLETAARRIETGQGVPEEFPRWVVEFFRTFADHCHHGKEEELLFPLLEERGVPRDGGPIGVMLSEHTLGRDYVERMDNAAEDPFDGRAFAQAARQYIALLREHIFKENNILFPWADRCLSEADDALLVQQFDEMEEHHIDPHAHCRFVEDVERWENAVAAGGTQATKM